jgi:hypothetical protein
MCHGPYVKELCRVPFGYIIQLTVENPHGLDLSGGDVSCNHAHHQVSDIYIYTYRNNVYILTSHLISHRIHGAHIYQHHGSYGLGTPQGPGIWHKNEANCGITLSCEDGHIKHML